MYISLDKQKNHARMNRNRRSGDNGGNAPPESPGCWEPGGKQAIKWTAEGAVKGVCRVFCDVRTYVSCRGYVGIP